MGERFRNIPWREALKNIKPVQRPLKDNEPINEEPLSDTSQVSVVEQDQPEQQLTEEGLLPEDQEIFDRIKRIAGLNKGGRDENRYWRVRDTIRNARRHGVDYELDRWLSTELRPVDGLYKEKNRKKRATAIELSAVLEPIRHRGWISDARNWLESATTNGMKYGRGTKEKRIVEAKKWADKAGVSLQKIIDEYNIDVVLGE